MNKIILAALILDLILGDPRRSTHPVVLIGRGISWCEHLLRKHFTTPVGLKFAGILLWCLTIFPSYFVTYWVIGVSYRINPWLGHGVALWLTYTTLAMKDLAKEARGIYGELHRGRVKEARLSVAGIVGRDTENLSEEEITRATIETVAENTVDGILSPLFYAFLGGPALAMAFKAASTLDSMVGNKSEKYLHLGWCSARMDDVLNFLPARLGGILMVAASAIVGLNPREAVRAVVSDSKKHASPNSGIPEAITAGALGVQLGGYNYYSGVKEFRAYMGKKTREMLPEDITKAVMLSISTSILTLIIAEIIYLVLVNIN
jgi:adenosylcobinamide-phosphate synthase